MSGISNFTIEKIINEDGNDLKANFVGVFPSNHTFQFVNFHNLVRQKHAPYLENKVHLGGVLLKFHLRNKYFCSIAMVS